MDFPWYKSKIIILKPLVIKLIKKRKKTSKSLAIKNVSLLYVILWWGDFDHAEMWWQFILWHGIPGVQSLLHPTEIKDA